MVPISFHTKIRCIWCVILRVWRSVDFPPTLLSRSWIKGAIYWTAERRENSRSDRGDHDRLQGRDKTKPALNVMENSERAVSWRANKMDVGRDPKTLISLQPQLEEPPSGQANMSAADLATNSTAVQMRICSGVSTEPVRSIRRNFLSNCL